MRTREAVDQTALVFIPNGAAIAAYLSAMIGVLVLGIVVLAAEASKPVADAVFAIGKLWMPAAERIGPYSGKETVMALAWLGSWLLLHGLFRGKQLNGRLWLSVFLVGVGVATLLVWPPVWRIFLGR